MQRLVACALAVLLSAPFAGADVAAPSGPGAPPTQPAASADLPDSPGFALQQQQTNQQSASGNQQPATAGQQNPPPVPVGTAAAPSIQPEGIPASRPAGAAIAPGKQRRVRIWTIRIAIVAAAAIAIGTVAATSLGSPSRPPSQ
jgi:alpha-beta hydrolase superfamily lysophospholipase